MLVWDELPVHDSSFRVRLWHLCPKAQREFVTLRAVSINESQKKERLFGLNISSWKNRSLWTPLRFVFFLGEISRHNFGQTEANQSTNQSRHIKPNEPIRTQTKLLQPTKYVQLFHWRETFGLMRTLSSS